MFYWFAILCSNTLGDYLADEEQGPGLGFMGGAVLIGGVIALIATAYFVARKMKVVNSTIYVGLFWAAFVLTRPFGATFDDVLARPTNEGGMGFGPGGSSAVLLAILVGVVIWTMCRDGRILGHRSMGGTLSIDPDGMIKATDNLGPQARRVGDADQASSLKHDPKAV